MRIFPLIFLFLACFAQSTAELQPRMVKIYGAGGFAEMEEYQSGFLISADGLIATVFSPVLNTDTIDCVLSDGSRYTAELLGVEPILEIALLKIERNTPFPFFDLAAAAARTKDQTLDGTPILALSNAIGNEPVSVQAGVISGTTRLDASRRAFAVRYHGPVYILDVTTNNPGAAGGALVSADGKNLLGILGKELQNSRTGCWLNFALPAYVLQEGIQADPQDPVRRGADHRGVGPGGSKRQTKARKVGHAGNARAGHGPGTGRTDAGVHRLRSAGLPLRPRGPESGRPDPLRERPPGPVLERPGL